MYNSYRNEFEALKKALLILIFCFIYTHASSQVTSSELKAALILHFCENVSWQNELPDTIQIRCIDIDDEMYNFLKPAEQNIEIKKRKLSISKSNNLDNLQGTHAIYYGNNKSGDLMRLFNYAKNNNTLLITNNIDDELFVLINFIDKPEKVEFKVNVPNLNLAGFELMPNLLLNGGSVVDINSAYRKFEERIQNSKKKLDESEKALLISLKQLNQKDSLLLEKEKQLIEYTRDIDTLKLQSGELERIVKIERKQIENQQEELKTSILKLDTLKNNIKLKEQEYTEANANLAILKDDAKKLKKEISEKDRTLSEKEVLIASQQRTLFLIIALAIALIIAGITLYRLFILKKKHNSFLAKEVDNRTKELKISNLQYQSLFNLAPVALWETDFSEVKKYMNSFRNDGVDTFDKLLNLNKDLINECIHRIQFININKAAHRLFGIQNDEELISVYENLHLAGELNNLVPELQHIFEDKVSNTFESIRSNQEGKRIELIVSWIDISEKPGSYKRVLFSLIDITRLREIERELKRHQNELETLVKEKTDDLEAANEELQSINTELFNKNSIINSQNTELKATLLHLKETQTQLLHSEKMASLGILTAGVAHEINNPLNFIMGAYEGLKIQNEENDNVEARILLEALKTGLDRTSNIVKSLNQFSRSNQVTNEECNIHEIIENCLVMIQNKIKDRIEVNKTFAAESFIVPGNVGSMHQVFLNILTNAEQAILNKGEISIKTSSSNDYLNIEISDSGHGISDEHISKITDPFFTTKNPGEGTGLGLSITYKIIQDHEGTLEFVSELKKGTTAKISLPLKNAKNE